MKNEKTFQFQLIKYNIHNAEYQFATIAGLKVLIIINKINKQIYIKSLSELQVNDKLLRSLFEFVEDLQTELEF